MSARRTLLKFSPLMAPFLLLFVGGLALAVAQSFGLWLPFPYEGGPLDAYRALLRPYLLASIGFSVYVALVGEVAFAGGGCRGGSVERLGGRTGQRPAPCAVDGDLDRLRAGAARYAQHENPRQSSRRH